MAKKEPTPIDEAGMTQEVAEQLLQTLGVSGSVTVSIADDIANVVLETEDSGVVIGYHGEVLEALQLVLSLAISKKIGRFLRVSLEIGDYKKNRTEYLSNLAQQAKERVLQDGQEVSLPNLRSWERRVVHLLLQDDTDVVSESVGEGKERTLIIRPRA